jgi:hypothetical protein
MEASLSQDTSEATILQNGGFEEGLARWEEIHGQAGSIGLSNSIAHSGFRSLVIELRPSKPGGTPSAMVEGVFQNVTITKLRGLVIEAWYLTQISTSNAALRLTVGLGDLSVRYYLFYGPDTAGATVGENQTVKSLLRKPALCIDWCSVTVDATSDFRQLFDSAKYDRVLLGSGSTQVTVSMELMISLTNSAQYVFWDDVNATAEIPHVQTTTTRSVTLTPATSSAPVLTTTSGESARSLSAITTVHESTNEPRQEQTSSNLNGLLITAALVFVVVALGVDLARRMRPAGLQKVSHRRLINCSKCGMVVWAHANFCDACGTRLQP